MVNNIFQNNNSQNDGLKKNGAPMAGNPTSQSVMRFRGLRLALVMLLVNAPVTTHAMDALPDYGSPLVVPDEVLAEQRGGFYGQDGLIVAIGLEQAIYLNGEAVHHSVLRTLSPLNSNNPLPRDIMDQVVIRSGFNGTNIDQQLSETGWVTIIQNNSDGERIEHQITLDIELHNVRMPFSDLGRSLEGYQIEGAGHH